MHKTPKYRFQKSPSRRYLLWASLKTARRQKPSIRKKRSPREKSARVVVLYKGTVNDGRAPWGRRWGCWAYISSRFPSLAGKFGLWPSTPSSAYASAKLSAGSHESCVLLGWIQLSIGKGENSGNAPSCAWYGSSSETKYWNSFCFAATSSVLLFVVPMDRWFRNIIMDQIDLSPTANVVDLYRPWQNSFQAAKPLQTNLRVFRRYWMYPRLSNLWCRIMW